MNLSQTDKIFGALLIGFLIYITVRGQLPSYIQLFTAGDASPPPAPASGSSGGGDLLGSILGGITGAGEKLGLSFFGI